MFRNLPGPAQSWVISMLVSCSLLGATGAQGTIAFSAPFIGIETGGIIQDVATGDLNEDGKQDLAIVSQTSGTVSILLGHGDGTFASPQSYVVGAQPGRVVLADMNGDAHLDVVTILDAGFVSVLLGAGNGTLSSRIQYAAGSSPRGLAIGDLNGDGKLDAIVSNANANTVSVMLGIGGGALGSPSPYLTGSAPGSVALGDLNSDGHLDVIVADSDINQSAISILLGTGNGSLLAKSDRAVTQMPTTCLVADFNEDGKLDIAVMGQGHSVVSVLLGIGDGTTGSEISTPIGTAGPMIVADFNHDGHEDLALTGAGDRKMAVVLGHGDGSFGPALTTAAGDYPYGIAFADFNSDNKLDVVAVAGGSTATAALLLGNGDGSFGADNLYDTGYAVTAAAAGDLNGDGFSDLVTLDMGNNVATVMLAQPDESLVKFGDIFTNIGPSGIKLADMDGDGRLDIIIACTGKSPYFNGALSIFLGAGAGVFGPKADYIVGHQTDRLAIGDMNNDGKLDVVAINYTDLTVSVSLGAGSGVLGPPRFAPSGQFPADVKLADLNGDGALDVVIANDANPGITVLLGDGTGGLVPKSIAAMAPARNVALGDLNGDGYPDLVFTDGDGIARFAAGLGDGSFGTAQAIAAGPQAVNPIIRDINGDGRPDLIVENRTANTVSVLQGLGGGGFGPKRSYGVANEPLSLDVADINHDGKLDLVVGNGGVSVRYNLDADIITATEVVEFLGEWTPDGLTVRWMLSDATANDASLESSTEPAGPWLKVAGAAHRDGEVMYLVDVSAESGRTRYYRLINSSGRVYGSIVVNAGSTALQNGLSVSPMPVTGDARIRFALRRATAVSITLHDVEGRWLATIASGMFKAGYSELRWNGHAMQGPVEPGVYFMRMQSEAGVSVSRVVIQR